ncbi:MULTISPECIES: dihydrofolate reductase family protein [unclassified Saccharothrix]|uniref:dihydrofolate reductase family protein n=1 Tax=unclassified Saccharothrix TaxID=2593673 RepID=UPI00307DE213
MGIVTCGITVSVDGFVAGPDQTVEDPLGVDGELLHRWQFEQADRHPAELAGILDAGAFVMGRNMFGPVRGEWEGDWRGWWGDEPPYHAPVFVLTHHAREPVEMLGGTTFHFVTDGVQAALERAREAAGDRNVAVAGGASVVNQCLSAGLIDELWLHVAPMTLGSGARLFEGVGRLDLEPMETRGTDLVSHVRYRVRR